MQVLRARAWTIVVAAFVGELLLLLAWSGGLLPADSLAGLVRALEQFVPSLWYSPHATSFPEAAASYLAIAFVSFPIKLAMFALIHAMAGIRNMAAPPRAWSS